MIRVDMYIKIAQKILDENPELSVVQLASKVRERKDWAGKRLSRKGWGFYTHIAKTVIDRKKAKEIPEPVDDLRNRFI